MYLIENTIYIVKIASNITKTADYIHKENIPTCVQSKVLIPHLYLHLSNN